MIKFQVSKRTLLARLADAKKVVNGGTKLSVFDNLLFDLKEKELAVTGSDQETTVTAHVSVDSAKGGGSFLADAKLVFNMLEKLPDTGITFSFDQTTCGISVEYQNGEFKFVGDRGDRYPVKVESEDVARSFDMPAKAVVDGIQHTAFAAASDNIRPQICGVYWDIRPDEVVFAATDTHKLVCYRATDVQPHLEFSFILPTKPASILANMLKRDSGTVTVTADSRSATFCGTDSTLTCRLIEARYPKYQSVIPASSPHSITVDKEALASAIRRVSVFADTAGKIKLELGDGQIRLTAENVDCSTSAAETVPCDYRGDSWTIAFRNGQLLDILGNVSGENVVMRLTDFSHPCVFVPTEQQEGRDTLALLMPMMLE